MSILLSKRLSLVASKIYGNSVVADIGCDHGYLCSFLVETKKCFAGIATDINEGPLESAKSFIKDKGLDGSIQCRISDGLKEIQQNECDEIAIAGMGGELIAQIIDDCSWAKDKSKHYVFQPMIHPEKLIKYLVNNGFTILSQDLVVEEKHAYTVFDAVYDGNENDFDETYYYVGEIKDFNTPEAQKFFYHILKYLKNKMKGGEDFSSTIKYIEERL